MRAGGNSKLKKKATRAGALVALMLIPLTSAVAFTAQPASASPAPPPRAAQPVYSYQDSVTIMTYGLRPDICFDRYYNPLGFILSYAKYSGWSYRDAKGVSYVGWYQTWDNGWKTVVGPYTVDSVSHTYDCGLPQ